MAGMLNKVNATLTTPQHGTRAGMHVKVRNNEAYVSKMGHEGMQVPGVIAVEQRTASTAAIKFQNGEEWIVEWVPGATPKDCGCHG